MKKHIDKLSRALEITKEKLGLQLPKIYAYSLPKSGTYLWGVLLEELGFSNTGFHVSIGSYLDTLAHSEEINTSRPHRTETNQFYVKTFNQMAPGSFCFGHLSPMIIPPGIIRNNFRIICSKRHPREIVVSEFIDFRFRREDVNFVNRKTVKDTNRAFEIYLKRYGKVIRDLCLQYLSHQALQSNVFYKELMEQSRFFELDFRTFLNPDTGPDTLDNLIKFLGFSPYKFDTKLAWQNILNKQNKTKASEMTLGFDKQDLWTPASEKLYSALDFGPIDFALGYK